MKQPPGMDNGMLDENNDLPSFIAWPLNPNNKSPLLYLDSVEVNLLVS